MHTRNELHLTSPVSFQDIGHHPDLHITGYRCDRHRQRSTAYLAHHTSHITPHTSHLTTRSHMLPPQNSLPKCQLCHVTRPHPSQVLQVSSTSISYRELGSFTVRTGPTADFTTGVAFNILMSVDLDCDVARRCCWPGETPKSKPKPVLYNACTAACSTE